ncbi:hypothetical protein JCM19379_09000 [Methyloparacoccus murrellii]
MSRAATGQQGTVASGHGWRALRIGATASQPFHHQAARAPFWGMGGAAGRCHGPKMPGIAPLVSCNPRFAAQAGGGFPCLAVDSPAGWHVFCFWYVRAHHPILTQE